MFNKKIVAISDIHVDHYIGEKDLDLLEGDILIIAGDISDDNHMGVDEVNDLACNFNHTLVVLGNHDYCNKLCINEGFEGLQNFWKSELDSDVTLLLNQTVEIEGISFFGGTGWGHAQDGPSFMYEFRRACVEPNKFMTATDMARLNQEFKNALLDIPTGGVDVIITHHVPETFLSTFPGSRVLDPYFIGNFTEEAQHIGHKAWIFGHTHDSIDLVHDGCRYICNPRGYPSELYHQAEYRGISL